LFVLIFFGIVAVVGSYYLQVGSFSYTALLTGLIIGMPAAAVLAVDNYRDLHSDRRVGRRTFVIRFGLRAARIEYTLLMILPFTLLPLVTSSVAPKLTTALPFLALPWVFFLVYRFWKELPGPVFNGYMVATARVQLFLAALLVVSWGLGAT
jgi:1,4-dihydroxy-2-naphthoate octaprenyltransferase